MRFSLGFRISELLGSRQTVMGGEQLGDSEERKKREEDFERGRGRGGGEGGGF